MLWSWIHPGLPEYMIPAAIVEVPFLPRLPNGKVDVRTLADRRVTLAAEPALTASPGALQAGSTFGEFAQSSAAAELMAEGVDSLGMVRIFKKLSAQAAVDDAVKRTVNNLRAIFMFGVLVDHWAGCDDYSYCQVVDRALQFAVPSEKWKWLEYAVRSIGNYKTMSGFVLISAFQDAATPSLATSFAISDGVLVMVYFEMMHILDGIVSKLFCMSFLGGSEGLCFWTLGPHRWYLLLALLSRGALVLLHWARVPKPAQVLLVWLLYFTGPLAYLCMTEDSECPGMPLAGTAIWPYARDLVRVFWSGFYDDFAVSGEAWRMYDFYLVQKDVFFAALYVTGFHYLRPAVVSSVVF